MTVRTDWDEIIYWIQMIDLSIGQGLLVMDVNKSLADGTISLLKSHLTGGTLHTMRVEACPAGVWISFEGIDEDLTYRASYILSTRGNSLRMNLVWRFAYPVDCNG